MAVSVEDEIVTAVHFVVIEIILVAPVPWVEVGSFLIRNPVRIGECLPVIVGNVENRMVPVFWIGGLWFANVGCEDSLQSHPNHFLIGGIESAIAVVIGFVEFTLQQPVIRNRLPLGPCFAVVLGSPFFRGDVEVAAGLFGDQFFANECDPAIIVRNNRGEAGPEGGDVPRSVNRTDWSFRGLVIGDPVGKHLRFFLCYRNRYEGRKNENEQ